MNSSHFSHDVFISYSSIDQQQVDYIVDQLQNKYGIDCWICTNELRGGDDWRRRVQLAIRNTRICVLMKTQSALESTEVEMEINIAKPFNKEIVPFLLDSSDVDDSPLLGFLLNCHCVDGTKKPIDDCIEDLARDLCNILDRPFKKGGIAEAEEKEQKLKLKATPAEQLKPRKHFFGRDTLLDDLHKTFEEGERVVFLQGIGGIGKTQIAKNYVKKYGAEYDTIVYATYGGSIRDLILSDAPFTFDPPMNRLTKADGSKESDAELFERKIAALRACATEKTLLILDNFDTIYDEQFDTLKDIGGRLLVTTRCDYSKNNRVVQIDPIEKIEDLKKVFLKNYDGYDVSEDDPALTELIELVNRHTYTIELLAQHMEISGQTAGEMVEALKKEGIRSLNEEVGAVGEKTEIAYKNLLKMFRIFSLTAEERQVLTLLSLMPLEGVNERDFRSWAELKSRKVILNLQKRSLIIENVGGIALHPIVRDVVRCEAPANEENCEVFLENFAETIAEGKMWHNTKVEKNRYAQIAKSILQQFDQISSKTERVYDATETLLSFGSDPAYAVVLAAQLIDYYKKTRGEDSFEVARMTFKRGWVYAYNDYMHNSLTLSKEFLEKANLLFSRIPLIGDFQIASYTQTLVNLSKTNLRFYLNNREEHYCEKAIELAEHALKLTRDAFPHGNIHHGRVAGAKMQLAQALIEHGEGAEALKNIEEACEILISMHTEKDNDSMNALYLKASVLCRLGRFEEAKALAQKCSIEYVKFIGENHSNIYNIYLILGDCNVALGNGSQAQGAYEKALKIARRIYAPDARQLQEIEEKLKSIGCDRGTL